MSEQEKEKNATRIIDAVLRLKDAIDMASLESGLVEIAVTYRAKYAIDYIFNEMTSFYLGKATPYSQVESIAGVKIKRVNQ